MVLAIADARPWTTPEQVRAEGYVRFLGSALSIVADVTTYRRGEPMLQLPFVLFCQSFLAQFGEIGTETAEPMS